MKKSSNFKTLFQKIHKDNLLRSPFNSLVKDCYPSKSAKQTSKTINFNLNLSKKKLNEKKLNNTKHQRFTSETPQVVYTTSLPLKKYKCSLSYQYFAQILAIIQKQIYFSLKRKTKVQILSIKQQLVKLQKFCLKLKQDYEQMQQKFIIFEQTISKVLQNRITRAIFYFLYAKFLECFSNSPKVHKQLQLLYLCDEYSRDLNILNLTLYTCRRISKILMDQKNYQQSKQFAEKWLRLAVYLNNFAQQLKAISALKFIGFYNGIVCNLQQTHLTAEIRQQIIKNFHPLDDVMGVRKSQATQNFLMNTSQEIEKLTEDQEGQINRNKQSFASNLASISRNLTDRSKSIMRTVRKVKSIGQVHKYLQGGHCISIQPRCRHQSSKNRGQVLLTHSRKKSTAEPIKNFNEFYLLKVTSVIRKLIIMQYFS